MNSQTPSPDDEHPAQPHTGGHSGAAGDQPTEPLQVPRAVPPPAASGPAGSRPSASDNPGSPDAAGSPTGTYASTPTGADDGASQGYAFGSQAAPAPTTDFFGWIRSHGIYRGNDRWIGGVCSGIAHRLGMDPIIIRGVFIVLTLLAGIGVLLYGLAWALLPEPDGRIHVQEAGAGRWSSGMTGSLIATVL
ncbi:MAG: PspC domain-containing protein, partial [Actinomycetes bacterium]